MVGKQKELEYVLEKNKDTRSIQMKHDLSRATFIIPIKIESDDRLRNVITSICFLLDNFDTTVMVKEVDDQSRFVTEFLPQILEFCDTIDGLVHSFEHSTAPSFHRQREFSTT